MKPKKKLMAFRFKPESEKLLRRLTKKRKTTQVDVLETGLELTAKESP